MEIVDILKLGLGIGMVIVMPVAAVAFAPVVERWWTRAFGPPYAQEMLRREEEEKAERHAAERRVAERRASLEGQRTGNPAARGLSAGLPTQAELDARRPNPAASPRPAPSREPSHAAPQPTAPAPAPPAGGGASMLDLVNAERKQKGLPPLGPGSAAKEFLED